MSHRCSYLFLSKTQNDVYWDKRLRNRGRASSFGNQKQYSTHIRRREMKLLQRENEAGSVWRQRPAFVRADLGLS